jgi:selenide,water dikinase
VPIPNIKQNNTAKAGNVLFLTKPLGVGILTTAEKRGILLPDDIGRAAAQMMRLNSIGAALGNIAGITAMTDVTGFGLLGHLTEMCLGSGVAAEIVFQDIPKLPNLDMYLAQKSVPGGTNRNWASYGARISALTDEQRYILADPQTSGGLLIAVAQEAVQEVQELLMSSGLQEFAHPIGHFVAHSTDGSLISVQ